MSAVQNIFNVVIEISKGSNLKYEINKEDGRLHLDRVLFGSNVYPQNYGYIEKTQDHDGDPLDVVIISNQSFLPMSVVECRILGAVEMIDTGDRDTKLIAVPNVDNRFKSFQDIKNVPNEWILEIKDFFQNYKILENKKVELGKVLNLEEAQKIIKEAFEIFASKN